MHSDIERSAKVKGDVRNRREAIEISEPARRATARGVARKRRVNIAICEHQIIALEQRHDLTFAAICKIRGVQQGKCRWSEEPALFAAARGRLHERRGIPFSEVQTVTTDFEPALQ